MEQIENRDFGILTYTALPSFSQFTKQLENWDFEAFIYCEIVRIVFQGEYVLGRGANSHYVTILSQVKCLKHFLQA